MNARLVFLSVICAAVAATGCHHRTVQIEVQGVTAKAEPDVVYVRDRDFDSKGNFTVRWKPPKASQSWLVQFDPGDVPCERRLFVIQKGGQEECVINRNNIKEDHYYKYFAFAGAAHSQDPGIAHSRGAKTKPVPAGRQVRLFCLDLSTGAPSYCNNGDPPQQPEKPQPLAGVSPLDDIYWEGNSNWTIKMTSPDACVQTQISSSLPYCTIKSCPGAASSCDYTYTVTLNGATKGPFDIQVGP